MKTIIEMRYIAIFICMVLALILLKPWHIGKEIENEAAMSPEQDTLTVAIHDLLSNQYSDLEETKRLDKTIEQFLNQWEIKGASLAIMKNGRLIYSKGYGYANVEDSIPMDVFHIMRVASVSKLITAAGVMKLVENGKLSLQDKVFGKDGILNDSTKYGNIKDKRTRDITVENLLRHQGGFTTRYGDPMFNPTLVAQKMNSSTPATMETMIQFVLSRRLGFTPGTSTSYSNVGYGILSKVIEKVSGQEYEQFIQDSILRPAGCVDMHLGRNTYEERYPNEVKYYEAEGAIPVRACNGADTLVPSSNGGNNIAEFYGAGGWVASPTELLLFLAAIDGDDSQPDILAPMRTASPIIPSAVNLEVSIAVPIKSYNLPLVCVSLHILSPQPVPEVTWPVSACARTQSIAATHLHRSRVSYLFYKPESVLYAQACKW